MFKARPKTDRTFSAWGLGITVAALVAGTAAPASAQGLLDAIFGAIAGRQESPRASAYANPNTDGRRARGAVYGGGGTAFCVRTCDGRYFPIPHQANASPAQLCGAMCPAAKTKIFSGGEIGRAVAPDGSRYADMDNAFTFRERIVDNCSCNGKDALGLTPLDVNSDPTLRAGDIVATSNGLMAYSGAPRSRRTADAQGGNFTPVDSAEVARDVREKLANVTVTKP